MMWRIMWHPGANKANGLMDVGVSMLSQQVKTEAEARALVRELKAQGVGTVNVTANGSGKIMTGTDLKRWLDVAVA
jgi:hypothetical protein